MKEISRLATCGAVLALAAQIPAQVTEQWRRHCDRGNRYEGIVQIPVSGPALELRSFVAAVEPIASPVNLRVGFFLPAGDRATIFAQELEDRRHYWMESKPRQWQSGKWNTFGPWPTAAVIDVEKVPYVNIGIIVQAGSASDPLFLPAYVFHTSQPRASSYRFVFYTRSSLKSVVWSLYSKDDRKLRAEPIRGEKLPGEIFAFELPAEGLPNAEMRLEIEATRPVKGRDRVWAGRLFAPAL